MEKDFLMMKKLNVIVFIIIFFKKYNELKFQYLYVLFYVDDILLFIIKYFVEIFRCYYYIM